MTSPKNAPAGFWGGCPVTSTSPYVEAHSKSTRTEKEVRKRRHSLEPQNVGPDTWYYEEARGLTVVHRGDIFVIPWRKVAASVDRHRRVTP